jgi:small subunit ribosomal protein S4e
MARLKRLEVPGFWPIEKKTKKYTVSIQPGTHSKDSSLTIAVILRDVLKHAETLKEVRQILNSGTVKVDGLARRTTGFPVGLMDIFSVGKENYRILPGKNGFYLKEDKGEFKLKKIVNRTMAKKKKMQLNFHDGTNMINDDAYKTGDVVLFDIESRKIKDAIKMEKGNLVIVTKGNNRGVVGKLESIKIVKSPEPNIAEISASGRKIMLPLDYVFPIGRTGPVIDLGEENG